MPEDLIAPSAGATEAEAATPAPGVDAVSEPDTSGLSKQAWLSKFNEASLTTVAEATDAAAAPVAEEAAPVAPVAPEAAEPQPVAAGPEASPEEQLAKFREGLKKSNLDPELKKVVNDAYVRDRMFREAGFSVKDAKTLQQIGFTPDRAMKLAQQFPTDEIADVTVGQAHAFQSMLGDFEANPEKFLVSLNQTNAEAAGALVDLVVDNINVIRPEKVRSMIDAWGQRLVAELERDAAAGDDEDFKEAVGLVASRLFPGRGKQTAPSGPPDPRLSAAEQRLKQYEQREEQLRQQQAQQQNQQRQQFMSDVQGTAAKMVVQEIEKVIPPNVPAEARAEFVEVIFNDVYRAATSDRTVMNQLNTLLQRAPLTPDGFNHVVSFAAKVAKGYIGPKAAQRLNKWTAGVIANQDAKTAVAAAAAQAGKAPPKVATAARPAPQLPAGKAPKTRNEWLNAFNSLT